MALSKWLPGLVVSFLLVAVSFAAPTAALQVVSWIVLGREHKHGKLEVAELIDDTLRLEKKQNFLGHDSGVHQKTQSLIEKPKH